MQSFITIHNKINNLNKQLKSEEDKYLQLGSTLHDIQTEMINTQNNIKIIKKKIN